MESSDLPGSRKTGRGRRGPGRAGGAVESIGRWIGGGLYPPGKTLPTEGEIAERLGIGRSAVREAIRTLAGKGLIRTERRAGTIVQPRRQWNMLDPDVLCWIMADAEIRSELQAELTLVRNIVEPEVAALAARNATTTETLRLFEAYEAMERHRNDRTLAIEADISFHERLFEASHSQLLLSLVRAFAMLLRANFEIAIQAENGYIRNLEEHRSVAEAVQRRNPGAARRAMSKLLANNRADLEKILAKAQ